MFGKKFTEKVGSLIIACIKLDWGSHGDTEARCDGQHHDFSDHSRESGKSTKD